MLLRILVCVAVGLVAAIPAFGSDSAPGLYVIYDSSNSMWGELDDGSRKYESARNAISDFLDGDFGEQELALRVYGAQRADDCSDSAMVVPFQSASTAAPLISDAVSSARPTGRTPIHLSLGQALEDFGDRPGRILLISDGIESCGADPCALLQEWRDSNVDIEVHIVGFGVRAAERPALVCMANAAGTPFVEAASAAELTQALQGAEQAQVQEGSPASDDGEASVVAAVSPPVLILQLRNADGESMTGGGTAFLVDETGAQEEFSETQSITTHSRNAIIPGRNMIRAGIVTRNGDIPFPNEQAVDVAAIGETVVSMEIVEPPQVRVTLQQDGAALRPTGTVEALIDGEGAFSFRTQDVTYVNPGTYTFRTSPNDFNRDLETTVLVPDAGIADVVFDLAPTVSTTVRFFAAPWGDRLSGAIHFFRDGEDVAGANAVNAVRLAPGIYSYAMSYKFATLEGELEITPDVAETIDIEVPAARIIVRYQDVLGAAEDDKRFFVESPTASRRVQQSGEHFFLLPGTYMLEGWGGSYEPMEIEVSAGDDLDLVFHAIE